MINWLDLQDAGNSRAPRFPATQRVASLAGRVLVRLSAQCLISVANRPAAVYIADNEATIKWGII